ncbi:MAG: hypothetical protein ABEJ64_01530 [Candidatus Nanohaloarchaea archaeon]
MVGIIMASYLLVVTGFLMMAAGAAAYYLEKDHYRKLLAAGAVSTLSGIGMLVLFLASF